MAHENLGMLLLPFLVCLSLYPGRAVSPPDGASNIRKEMVYNTTELLDGLLMGYDKKLRPGFGGMYFLSYTRKTVPLYYHRA